MNQEQNTQEALIQALETQIDFDRLEELKAHLERDICGLLDTCGLYYRIFSRVKSRQSIARKLHRGAYGTDQNPKKLQDLIGLRIVLYYSDDLSIGREIMEKTFQRVGTWSKSDFNAAEFRATKINGVFSLPSEHFKSYTKPLWSLPIDTTFEIQFRTVFFEGWHEIEHDMRYKSLLPDNKFWESSEDLSRILHCILANLELSDWSLVQLFERLSYNHYQNGNWALMLKTHFRLRMDDREPIAAPIAALFQSNRHLARQFFKCERIVLIRELLKQDYVPGITFDVMIKLLNDSTVHNPEIAEYYRENDPLAARSPAAVRKPLLPLERNTLFHLEIPLLHKEIRDVHTEFHNASHIIYRWIRHKLGHVFSELPPEATSLDMQLPGYRLSLDFHPETLTLRTDLSYIDADIPGTLWQIRISISSEDGESLLFSHDTSLYTPTTATQRETFSRPSYLAELSSKIGLIDQERLGTQGRFVTTAENFQSFAALLHAQNRRLPVIAITQQQNTPPGDASDYREGYDMNTFPVNGTRLAKVIGLYAHVYMLDWSVADLLAAKAQLPADAVHGGIMIFWPDASGKAPTIYTHQMIREAHFDFNRFAYHDQNFNEKAFRSRLAQIIKDDQTKRGGIPV